MLFTDLTQGLPALCVWLFVIIMGLALGSFATCILYRVPRGMSIWRRDTTAGKDGYRSFCPKCRHPLRVMDLVPVLSWMATGGRCRYCRAPIGLVYPMVELATLVLMIVLYNAWGFSPAFLLGMAAYPVALFAGARVFSKKA